MVIGIDLDNTIICYDDLFHNVALDNGWINSLVPKSKDKVKSHIIENFGNDIWTILQGEVYGPRVLRAEPYSNSLDFFILCKTLGISAKIISHKTKTPAIGKLFDLRSAAINWLNSNHFFDTSTTGLRNSDVYFYDSREDKIQAIKDFKCDIFIDDLTEVLDEFGFDTKLVRILFDPNNIHIKSKPYYIAHSWLEVIRRIEIILK